MSINSIMRKLGYISEKNLIKAAIDTYDGCNTCNTKDEKWRCYRAGNTGAIGEILGRLGIDFTKIVMDRRTN